MMIHSDENGTMTPLSKIMRRYEQMLENNWTPDGEKVATPVEAFEWANAPEIDTRANASPDASFTDAAKRAGLFDRKGSVL